MSEVEERHYLRNGGETLPDAREALEWAGETRAAMVDLKFCDLLGTWQHVTLPIRAFDESAFDEGLGFDGSSIRGWQAIQDSDMLLMPDASSAILDPATEAPTLSLVCEIADPVTREPYARDPRGVARRAEEHLRASGIADTAYFGPECEFFVFDEVHYDLGPNCSHYSVDSPEGYWNSGKPGLGYTARPKEGYFPAAPSDQLHDLRTEMVLTLERLGIPCEFHHHEVASGGQCEIDLRFTTLTRMADQVMTYKYVVKNVARPAREDRDLHAEADLRRQRLGHAHAPVAVDGGNAADGGQVRVRGALATCTCVHRRAARPRARAARLLRSDDELVPAARSRLRGAGQPRLLAAEPLRLHPDPDVLRVGEGEADRVPAAGLGRQSVSRVLGDADGRPRRNRARARPRCARGLRPVRGRRRRRAAGARRRSEKRSTRSSASTSSCSQATCSRRSSSRPGSPGSGRTRSTLSGCGPIPRSSPCITTAERDRALRRRARSGFLGRGGVRSFREDPRCPVAKRCGLCSSQSRRAWQGWAPWPHSPRRRRQAKFELVLQAGHEAMPPSPTYPFGLRHTGTFTSSAPFCPSGTLVDIQVLGGVSTPIRARRQFTCDDGSGSTGHLGGHPRCGTWLHKHMERRGGNRPLCRHARTRAVSRSRSSAAVRSTSGAWSSGDVAGVRGLRRGRADDLGVERDARRSFADPPGHTRSGSLWSCATTSPTTSSPISVTASGGRTPVTKLGTTATGSASLTFRMRPPERRKHGRSGSSSAQATRSETNSMLSRSLKLPR